MKNEQIHATLLALVGGYLLYLAWQLFDKFRTGTQEMPDAAFILSILVFTAGGIGVLVWAFSIWRRQRAGEKKPEREEQPDAAEEPGEQKKNN